ncbi:hypothetical protein JYT31_00990 [Beggiatoa alba]|nr:hypothetical protein [Beggiatoa alba]
MKAIKILLFSLILLGCANNEDRTEEIVARLKSEGESYFLQLVSTREYEKLLDRIEGGDAMLIRSTYLLAPWVDASTSLSLKYSLSRALTKKPNAVMGLVPKYFSATDICTIPYIEESINVELSHINASIKALEKISDKNITNSSVKCISIYKDFRTNITISLSRR